MVGSRVLGTLSDVGGFRETPASASVVHACGAPYSYQVQTFHGRQTASEWHAGDAGEATAFFDVRSVECQGLETMLADCTIGGSFAVRGDGCDQRQRLYVACRQFPVQEAGEADADPAAGVLPDSVSLAKEALTL